MKYFVFFAPRAPALNLLTARGGLETAFQKKLSGARSRYALLPRCADLCPCPFLLPPRVPTLRPALLPKCQKARPALLPKCQKAWPCCLRPGRQTTVADAVNSRAPTQPTHIALALRSETSPTFVLAWQRNRSANNGMLLPHHISPPILAPPCSCFASAYRIRLRQRCLIIATRPRPVCSESTVVPLSPLDRIPV